MKNFFKWIPVLALVLLGCFVELRADPVFDPNDFSDDALSPFSGAAEQLEIFFGLFAVTMVLITGFMVGRKWFKQGS